MDFSLDISALPMCPSTSVNEVTLKDVLMFHLIQQMILLTLILHCEVTNMLILKYLILLEN